MNTLVRKGANSHPGKRQGRTIFEGEAVHDGHAVEPVLVAGLAHGEETRAIAQQSALQPAGNVPCAKENAQGCNRLTCLGVNGTEILGRKKEKKRKAWRKEEVASPFTSAFCGSGCSSAFLVKSTGMVAHGQWRCAFRGVRVNKCAPPRHRRKPLPLKLPLFLSLRDSTK